MLNEIDQELVFRDYCQDIIIGKGSLMIAMAVAGPACSFNQFQFLKEPTLEKIYEFTKIKSHVAYLASVDLDSISKYHSSKDLKEIIEGKTYFKGADRSCVKRVTCFRFDIDLKGKYPEILSLSKVQRDAIIYNFFKDQIEPYLGRYMPIKYVYNTGGGLHLVVVLEIPIEISGDSYSKIYHQMANELEGKDLFQLPPGTFDRSCSNINRIMRLPLSENSKYSIDTPTKVIFLAHCEDAPSGNTLLNWIKDKLNQEKEISAKPSPMIRQDPKYLNSIVSKYITTPGSRNVNTMKLSRELLAAGLNKEDALKYVLEFQAIVDTPDDRFTEEEAKKVFEKQWTKHQKEPFSTQKKESKQKSNYPDIADNFLMETYGEAPKLVHHKNKLYLYNDEKYDLAPLDMVRGQIMRFLNNSVEHRCQSTKRTVEEVLAIILAKYQIDQDQTPPFWTDDERTGFFIPLEGQILHIEKKGKSIEVKSMAHSHHFFCTYKLKIKIGSKKKASFFFKKLKEIIPDPEEQLILQEFIGLCLIQDASFESMLFLYGKGGNGKGVICTIISCLIGESNISHVPIELLYPNSFALSNMIGKNINMPSEIGKLPKDAESMLKTICSGEYVHINEKFERAYDAPIKAKMLFCTNILPIFRDTSDAISRRTIIIHLKQNFTSTHKKDTRLKDPQFWMESGELPAIFDWALKGLIRLIKRGEFKIPKHMQAYMKNHFLQMDPNIEFISDNLKEEALGIVSPSEVYKRYKKFCFQRGVAPENQSVLTQKIRAHFPLSTQDDNGTENRVFLNEDAPKRDRKLRGIRFLYDIESFTDTHNTPIFQIKKKEKQNSKSYLPGYDHE